MAHMTTVVNPDNCTNYVAAVLAYDYEDIDGAQTSPSTGVYYSEVERSLTSPLATESTTHGNYYLATVDKVSICLQCWLIIAFCIKIFVPKSILHV